jgi:hypothetical protein
MNSPSAHLALVTTLAFGSAWALAPIPSASSSTAAFDVTFARDVKPIFDAHCADCHSATRMKGKLRLDQRASAMRTIVAGNSAQSELIARVTATDADERMPQKGAALTAHEIEILRTWIDKGAEWPAALDSKIELKVHWAYVKPVMRAAPPLKDSAGVKNPIDVFVRAKLEREGLRASPEADKVTLIRRATLDLTGLPPTPSEVDEFVADKAPDAYEHLVDRLLASPRYGERMAQWWLDLARYADTNGYEKDARRTMWPWRDWVIRAFNDNMSFDGFTIEQLAGDLLPNATDSQRIATGFHRNTLVNEEGGTDPEEFRTAAVVDRTNTTAAVWLGSTLGCAQCHDHKFDPFSQREYYELFSFFDNTSDSGDKIDPVIPAPSEDQRVESARLAALVDDLNTKLEGDAPKLDAQEKTWRDLVHAAMPPEPVWDVLVPEKTSALQGSTLTARQGGAVFVGGPSPDRDTYTVECTTRPAQVRAIRLEVLADPALPSDGPGRAANGNFVLTDFALDVVKDGVTTRVKFSGAEADFEQTRGGRYRIAEALDGDAASGWAIEEGEHLTRTHRAIFVPEAPLSITAGTRLRFTLACQSGFAGHTLGCFRLSACDDVELARWIAPPAMQPWRAVGPFTAKSQGEAFDTVFAPETEIVTRAPLSRNYGAAGPAWQAKDEWRDGDLHALACENCALYLERRVDCDEQTALRVFAGADDAFKLWVNGVLVHAEPAISGDTVDQHVFGIALERGENHIALKVVNGGGPGTFFFQADRKASSRIPDDVVAALRLDENLRSAEQRAAVRHFWRTTYSPAGREMAAELASANKALADLRAQIPTTPVMQELTVRRKTHVLQKGSYLSPGAEVKPAVPSVLGALDATARADRLALARWLVAPDNPLTARVFVNRTWERFFGRGIVATVDDFGTRGDPPTNPELLDWLALEFVRTGWDVKRLMKTIVTSATYRQSSNATPSLLERDPDDVLLARAPRLRLEIESLRDVALAASGLLVEKLGGPSVMPPQPDGVWAPVYSDDRWMTATTSDRYRRGLYVFWRRSSPYATYMLFDAPSRELACTRRPRTNTPLQALALLNDPAFVECARALARRTVDEGGATDAARATYAFQLCTARKPRPDEVNVLVKLVVAERRHRAAAQKSQAVKSAVPAVATDAPSLAVDAPKSGGAVEDSREEEVAAWLPVANVVLNLDETVTRN